jgi:uncharacterized protein YrrD
MLDKFTLLKGRRISAIDGDVGNLSDAFFDDESWIIRYLVVNTGDWFSRNEVLISPYSVMYPLAQDKHINVALTRQKVKDSPDIDTHQPVSRQHEFDYMSYYDYPAYWEGGGFWGVGAYPVLPMDWPTAEEMATEKAVRQRNLRAADGHLRSSAKVAGYDIQATDGSIGHIHDLVFDDASWVIRYLVVDTRNWWPGGKKVLVAMHWIEGIDWATGTVRVNLTRDAVKSSPEYDDELLITRDYETQLYGAYQRTGYWE